MFPCKFQISLHSRSVFSLLCSNYSRFRNSWKSAIVITPLFILFFHRRPFIFFFPKTCCNYKEPKFEKKVSLQSQKYRLKMAYLEQLRIAGIRSYGQADDETALIRFLRPLTILSGPNGSGKTVRELKKITFPPQKLIHFSNCLNLKLNKCNCWPRKVKFEHFQNSNLRQSSSVCDTSRPAPSLPARWTRSSRISRCTFYIKKPK